MGRRKKTLYVLLFSNKTTSLILRTGENLLFSAIITHCCSLLWYWNALQKRTRKHNSFPLFKESKGLFIRKRLTITLLVNQGAQNLLLPIQPGTVPRKYRQRMQQHGSYSCFLLTLLSPPANFRAFFPLCFNCFILSSLVFLMKYQNICFVLERSNWVL